MAFKYLRDWLRGVISDNDSLDMPEDSLAICRNYIIQPGMVQQRPKAQKLAPTFTSLAEFQAFTTLTGSATTQQFILAKDGTSLEKWIVSGNSVLSLVQASLFDADGYGVGATVFTQSGNRPEFYSIQKNQRICRVGNNDSTNDNFDTLWYGYVSRDVFNAIYGSFAGWYLQKAQLEVLDGSSTTNKIKITATGSGTLSGRYFVRVTLEHDGYQDGWHKDASTINGEHDNYVDCTGAELDIEIAFNDETATLLQSLMYNNTLYNLNRRVTAFNIWMAWSDSTSDTKPRTAYYRVARIAIDDNNWALDYSLDTGSDTDEQIDGVTDPVTFAIDNTPTFNVGDYIKIDTEILRVTVINGSSITATRGTPGVHVTNSDIYIGRPMITCKVKLSTGGKSADFPANHESYNTDDVRYSLEEEYHLTKNTIPGVTVGFDVKSYSGGVWVNGRHFIYRPNIATNRIVWRVGSLNKNQTIELPFDQRQTVLFSKINQPDAFDFMIDYIDCSTEQGDPVMTCAEIAGDLIILKKYNIFIVSLNNTGTSLDWGVTQHFQQVGTVSKNGTTKGNGLLFFPGEDNVFIYDGKSVVPITHQRVRDAYLTELASVSDKENIWSIYDPTRERFMMYMPGTQKWIWIYELKTRAWTHYDLDDTANTYDIKSLFLGHELDILAGNDDGTAIIVVDPVSDGGEVASTKTITTQWTPLNDHPHEEKRVKFLRLDMNLQSGGYNIQLYANGDASNPVWTATNQTAQAGRGVHYHEVSEVGRIFKVQIQVTTHNSKIYGIEFNYEEMGDQQ